MTLRKMLAAVCVAVMVIGAVGVTLYLLSHKDLTSTTPSVRSSALQPPAPSIPTPDEFKIGIDVTAENCPQPGTCVFTYTIAPKYVGSHPLPEQDFTVFYEVRGGFASQDGSFTVSMGQARMYKDVQIEGPHGAQFEVVVTQISAVAGPKPVS